jgi:LemA protein
MSILIILLIILGIIILWFIGGYNGFVRGKNRIDEAWADIDVQLKRRYDLIPNLINTVKGYAGHEKDVFEKVTAARTAAMSAESTGNSAQSAQAENMLSSTLKSLFAVSEAYPELKANENFLQLQRELGDTEDKIQSARRFYNANVRDFNTRVEMFPSNIIAGAFKYMKRDLYDLEDAVGERENVKVEF